MTIDERLEAITGRLEGLTERHEALTQSVELLAKMQSKTEDEIRRLGRFIRTIVLDHKARLLALEGDPEDHGK